MMFINGALVESLPATDRGLAYGDGIFRTLRATEGRPLHWARQYATLNHDCVALALPCPPEAVLLSEVLQAAAGLAQSVIKIMVTRGSGPRGYAVPQSCSPTRIVVAEAHAPAQRREGGVNLHLCRLRLAHQPALAGIKHLNRLENVLARAEWSDAASAEGLLLDQEGLAIGGTMSNLFIVEQGTLITPDLSRCGVAGVTRERVMDLANKAGMACRVEHLPLPRVLDADEVFLVNSLIGLWPVARLMDRTWTLGPWTRQMAQRLEADDAAHA